MAQVPQRREYLIRQVTGRKDAVPDFRPETLLTIWRWFLKSALVVKNEETGRPMLSLVTEYILRDIGMYVGQMWVINCPQLRWTYTTQPRNDFFVNRPLVQGFSDRDFDPPFPMSFEPIHMVGVQASGLLLHKASRSDLYELYQKWLAYVPHE